jgi:hypothetical protein
MTDSFEPRTEILPRAQQELWPLLARVPALSFVLYGGTAITYSRLLGCVKILPFDFLTKYLSEVGSMRKPLHRQVLSSGDH